MGKVFRLRTFIGEKGNVVCRLQDGRIVLFTAPYDELMEPDQVVDVRVVNIQHNYIIVEPTNEPPAREEQEIEEIESTYIPEVPEVYVDDIVEELEKMIEKLSGNAKVIPRAILKLIRLEQRVIRLEQLIVKILLDEA